MFFGTTLTGLTIHATDGEIGKIKDVYFTDAWKLQFIIADTRKWLPGKKVLLPFQVLQKIGAEEGYVRVTEDKEAIRLGQPVPDGERLTPYHQRAILDYFNWNQFKNNPMLDSEHGSLIPFNRDEMQLPNVPPGSNGVPLDDQRDELRSINEMTAFRAHAKDGKIGPLQI